ncbi:hypothetical protein PV703_11425 [Streptomyces sp. ME01-24h]|nr:hypothetical protein [Streptomyces sp. ME01-24h]
MVAFPNPEVKQVNNRDHLGNIWQAARVAGVKPDTIRIWVRRNKVEPMPMAGGEPLYHLPTIEQAAQVPRGRPRKDSDPPPLPQADHGVEGESNAVAA